MLPRKTGRKAAFTHKTRYFRKPHLYKNKAIYPLCSRKKEDILLRERALTLLKTTHSIQV